MSKRARWKAVPIAMVMAVVLLGVGWFLAQFDLNAAAAWSNIMALFVAVVGVGIGLLGLHRSRLTGGKGGGERRAGPEHVPVAHRRTGEVGQTSRAARDAYNVVTDTFTVNNGPRSGGE